MTPVRRGGRARTPDGATITWTQAEGARGTRWREAITSAAGVLVRAVLLEADPRGRPTRLEMTTTAGLLTLHPERDESALHGNLVAADGVRHLALGWSRDHELLVVRSPASAAITLSRLGGLVGVGERVTLDVLRIDDDLDPRPERWSVERTGEHGWHLRSLGGGEERVVTLDESGRPKLPDAVEWPLED